MEKSSVSRIGDVCCELGEGPHYDCSNDTAWWFDIVGMKLVEHHFANNETLVHALPKMASFVAAINAEQQLLAMEDGLYLRQIANGDLSRIVPLEDDNPITRSNDGRVHPSGRLWICTMGKRAEWQAGAIYLFDGSTIRPLFRKITIPNSICFSPDGRTGYFADTWVDKVWRVALDPATAEPVGEPEVFLTAENLPLGGHFDGSVTDADGNLWNAAWGAGSVSGFSPNDKTLIKTIEIPANKTSCPCFVGAKLDQLLVTSAWQGYDKAGRDADPGAGFTYLISDGFRGLAAVPVRLDAKRI